MKTYKENDIYVLESDAGKYLKNAKTGEVVTKIYSTAGVKMTDYYEIDASSLSPAESKTDKELLDMFKEEILASVHFFRENRKLTATAVNYSYDAETNTIVEAFT